MGLSSCLKNRDNYGHEVQFNFDRKGSTVNTPLGGAVSILVNFAIYGFFVLKIMSMINRENNDLYLRESIVTADEIGTHTFNEFNMLFYFIF